MFTHVFLKKQFVPVLLFIFINAGLLSAQQNYWVFFKDKQGVEFNPYQYFDHKAIERRLKSKIPLCDSTDFPLNQSYVEKINRIAGQVECQLRWFNAVGIKALPEQINIIEQLPFVLKTVAMEPLNCITAGKYDTILKTDEKELWEGQLNRMQGYLFEDHGFTGKGIRIAVFDAGFPLVDKIPAFEHLQKNKQIIATWDFARKKPFVFANDPHGTMVLSCIAGKIKNKKIGLAVDSEFLLARTEVDRTSYTEEQYWLQAVEWADKNGADIINSSIAFTYERYNTFEMNGRTSLVAKAANMAANKGILVINAMGNDGNRDWKIMATPADADSVLSVGAISPLTDFHAGFSSFGPTAEFKLKPNVVAYGRAIAAGKSKLEKVKGTSFSAPLVTGFAACAWQSMRYLTNIQVFKKIEESGHLFPYFDYAHGYGVPQASFFVNGTEIHSKTPTFEFIETKDTIFIEINELMINKKYLQNTNYLYYHIENKDGYLDNYWLVDVYKRKAAFIVKEDYPNGAILRAHYKGFSNEIKLR